MDGEQQDNTTVTSEQTSIFDSGMGYTSTGIPVILETFLSSFFVLSSVFFFFFEKSNVYCRSVALQGIIWFFILFILGFPFFILCIAFGGVCEIIFICYIVFYCVIRVALIVLAMVRSKSEKFIGIPPFTNLINRYASVGF